MPASSRVQRVSGLEALVINPHAHKFLSPTGGWCGLEALGSSVA